ncbi:MAG: TRAP transporter substrate-binding protein [Methylobacteriaceae bacterium]|nr:TRAP transporter substrate-binding protein [Methylobacteriaceae bacterium]
MSACIARAVRSLMIMGLLAFAGVEPATAADPVQLRIVGGLAGITQYNVYEQPFWSKEITERSGGRITARIQPFDQSGLRGQDALQLLQLGVTTFSTVNLSLAAGDDPELASIDLPGLAPDIATLRRAAAAFRPTARRILAERYGVELLGLYVYPAQVVYCVQPFRSLTDLAGRRIRTSSVVQSSFVEALGAMPVFVPFAEVVPAITKGVVDCAITGTLSGHEIGLSEVTSHLQALAVNWGLTLFAANGQAWRALPDDLRDVLREGIADLEGRIWESAERETRRGLACNIGEELCPGRPRGHMTLVPVSPEDEALRRRVLETKVLPSWLARCGEPCVTLWDSTLGPTLAITPGAP